MARIDIAQRRRTASFDVTVALGVHHNDVQKGRGACETVCMTSRTVNSTQVYAEGRLLPDHNRKTDGLSFSVSAARRRREGAVIAQPLSCREFGGSVAIWHVLVEIHFKGNMLDAFFVQGGQGAIGFPAICQSGEKLGRFPVRWRDHKGQVKFFP